MTIRAGVSVVALAAVFVLLGAADRAAVRDALTPQALRAAWADVASVEADIEQTKTSPHFTRPLKSRATLSWQGRRVVWTMIEPTRVQMIIEDGKIVGGGGPLPAAFDSGRGAALGRLLQALFTVDLEALRRDYDVELGPDRLVARGRPTGAVPPLVRDVTILFDSSLRPRTVTVSTDRETTEMVFAAWRVTRRTEGRP